MSRMNLRVGLISWAACGLLLGCGSSSGGGNGAAFVGTYTYSEGMVTPMNCMVLGQTIPPLSLTGDTVTITLGADSSHVQFSAGTACIINFSVSGTTATAAAGQTCTIPVQGLSAVINVSAWTLSLISSDTVSTSFSGTAPIGGASCTAAGSGTLVRNPSDASSGQ